MLVPAKTKRGSSKNLMHQKIMAVTAPPSRQLQQNQKKVSAKKEVVPAKINRGSSKKSNEDGNKKEKGL